MHLSAPSFDIVLRLSYFLPCLAASVLLAGCEVSKKNQLAPSDAVISLSSASSLVPANSAASVTVHVTKVGGAPVEDGTEVVISATGGDVDQRKVRTAGGEARINFQAGAQIGTARVTAASGLLSAELALRVTSAAPGSVSVFSTPESLPPGGGSAELLAVVSSPTGQLIEGAPVVFTTSTGTLSNTGEVITDAKGEARVTLQTTGTAQVRAAVQTFQSPALTVAVRQPAQIQIAVAPAEPTAGQPAVITVTAASNGQPAAGRLVIQFGDGNQHDVGNITGGGAATHTWAVAGGYNVTAEFSENAASTTRTTVRITVNSAPSTPSPNPDPGPNPNPPPSGGAGDELDLRQVTWLHQDVSSWSITSRITNVSISSSQICVDHTGAGRFPTSTFGTIQVEGNVWILAQFNGRWYAGTYDWLRPGQVCKGVTGGELGPDQVRVSPMDASWPGPRSGDIVGFMVSTRARDGVPAGRERTNVVLVRWP